MTRRHGPERAIAHPDLIGPTRALLEEIGRPYVIENVETARAELRDPIRLCGSSFGLGFQFGDEWLGLRKHRLFEASFPLEDVPGCAHVGRALPVYGNAGGSSKRDGLRFPGTDGWRAGMEIGWMTGQELGEAIPPAYTRWIGGKLIATL
jgi:DNA (cytosine-5)-methyltransferase 1